MDVLRTDDDRFAGLPDDPPLPSYVEVPVRPGAEQTLRVAVVDEGPRDAPVVLALHGEPSWSYLWRHVAAPLVGAGLRVVRPDLVGFGRSDKPAEMADHSYAAHVEWLRSALFEALDLRDVTLLCQDWGGLLGLRLLGEQPERFAAVVAANTGLPTGHQQMPPEWLRFRDFVQRTEDLPVGFLVAGAVATPMSDGVRAAYDAPFPTSAHKAGPRAMPGLIPLAPTAPGAAENRAAWEVLATFDRPFVCAFSDGDPITRGADRPFRERVPGARGQEHVTLAGGGHFLQEDVGPELAAVVRRVALGRGSAGSA